MLLDTRFFKPYKKHKKYYRKDELVCFYNHENNSWQMLLNHEFIQGNDFKSFFQKCVHISTQLKEDERIVCFINDLRLATAIFPDGEIENSKTDASGTSHPVYYDVPDIKFQFRNFSLFHISTRGLDCQNVHYMYEYLLNLAQRRGFDSILYCQYTIGWMSKRILTYDIKEKILKWYKENHNYINSVKEYEDQLIGCKSGLLCGLKGEHNDVLMIDLKSAYLSAFVHLDFFPIGRKRYYSGSFAMVHLYENKFYHVLVTTDDDVPVLAKYKQQKTYGFYKHDFETLKLYEGFDLMKWIVEQRKKGAKIEVYDCQKYGRLMPEIVEKMVSYFIEKSKATGFNKNAVKAFTEMFYGKALQKRDFCSKNEVYKYFVSPENYIRPEYSMMACSYIRLRLARMMSALGKWYYHDTDGIECEYTPGNEQFVKEENERIMELNRSLGFDCSIGTWEIEEKHARIYVIGRKQRMYYGDNGEFTLKVAGINKIDLMKHLKENDVEDPMEYFEAKRLINVPEYVFDYDFGFSDTGEKYISVGKDE